MNTSTMVLFFAAFMAISWLKTKLPWLANLPGDLKLQIGNGQVIVPVATCLIASGIVMLILAITGKKP